MFFLKSSLKRRNMHFVSRSVGGGEGHPIGLPKLRLSQFGLDNRRQRRDRKAVGAKPVAHTAPAERLELTDRFAKQA
jgi:hypothetical protein